MRAVETRHLTKRFRQLRTYRDLVLYPWRTDDRLAIDDLSFDVEEGELFGLLGENGAGKTTLIRMLATALLPTSGDARVAGLDVVRDRTAVRNRIGLVSSDERSFYLRLTGRQNLEFFAALYHLPRQTARRRIAELLEIVHMSHVADEPFHSYSTGMRHRVSIARGLLTDPQVLFLDEPTRSLDPLAAAEVRKLVRERLVEGMGRTALLATHSLDEAAAFCDRVAILRRGRLVAVGSVEELRARFALATVVEFRLRASANGLVDKLARLPHAGAVHVNSDTRGVTVEVQLRPGPTAMDTILRTVTSSSATVEAVEVRHPTLDDIYRLAVTGDQQDPPSAQGVPA